MVTTPECTGGLIAARSAHRQLKQLLTAAEPGESVESTLQAIKLLCDSVLQTLDDPLCQEKICEVERHAEELLTSHKRPRWGRSAPPGAMFLRRLTLRSLEAFDDRLKELEKAERWGGGAAGSIHSREVANP
jgi:hypothetical protein